MHVITSQWSQCSLTGWWWAGGSEGLQNLDSSFLFDGQLLRLVRFHDRLDQQREAYFRVRSKPHLNTIYQYMHVYIDVFVRLLDLIYLNMTTKVSCPCAYISYMHPTAEPFHCLYVCTCMCVSCVPVSDSQGMTKSILLRPSLRLSLVSMHAGQYLRSPSLSILKSEG